MKPIVFTIVCLILLCKTTTGQNRIELDFPKFAGQTVKLFYFQGNRLDSLFAVLDATGKGLCHNDLKGMVQVAVDGRGAVECIVGEARLQIVCKEDAMNRESVTFPGSAENFFLYDSFDRKSRLMEKQGWLQAGRQFYPPSSPLLHTLEKELEATLNSLDALDREIAASPLYAARFVEWAGFMNRLHEAEQQRDPDKARIIREEMENTARLDILYSSGQLWGSVQNFYISMFNRLNTPDKQDEYAASIVRTAERLSGAVRERFFIDAVSETERFGWVKAQEIIAQSIASNYPDMLLEDSNLQRLVGLYRTGIGNAAPALAGLQPAGEGGRISSPTLLVFYESGCNGCEIQLAEIKTRYAELQEKGIRVVSISADHDSLVYEYHAKGFPWPDKRCDYRGFEGEDFKNYGVIGTPTIFLIDEKGIIEGRYASLQDSPLGVKN